ncbi:MAG: double zinc ribbon domain-containing protein [Halobacteriota archaeon]
MSKITFRADDDLVDRLEALDTSKSEVMRRALRSYLAGAERDTPGENSSSAHHQSIDRLLVDRIDELIAERVGVRTTSSSDTAEQLKQSPVTVHVSVAGADAQSPHDATAATNGEDPIPTRRTRISTDTASGQPSSCSQCGEAIDREHVYCPNCGEKATNRLFCDCGDELRSEWAFCPSCGRRTPTADVINQ